MKIGILSDTHLGLNRAPFQSEAKNNYAKAIEMLKDCDIIIHAGDIFDRNEVRVNMMYHFLKPLVDNNKRMFYILGNHDIMRTNTEPEIDVFSELRDVKKYLVGELDESNRIRRYRDGNVNIIGIDYEYSNPMDKIQKALEYKEKGLVNILVIHQDLLEENIETSPETTLDPKYLSSLEGFDLIINGHIHNSKLIKERNPCILVPGSTSITRYHKDDLKSTKYVYIYDTDIRSIEKILIPNQRIGEIVTLDARGKSADQIYIELEHITKQRDNKIMLIDLLLDSPLNVSKYSDETNGVKINVKIIKASEEIEKVQDERLIDVDLEMKRDWKYIYTYEQLMDILDREQSIDELVDIVLKEEREIK